MKTPDPYAPTSSGARRSGGIRPFRVIVKTPDPHDSTSSLATAREYTFFASSGDATGASTRGALPEAGAPSNAPAEIDPSVRDGDAAAAVAALQDADDAMLLITAWLSTFLPCVGAGSRKKRRRGIAHARPPLSKATPAAASSSRALVVPARAPAHARALCH